MEDKDAELQKTKERLTALSRTMEAKNAAGIMISKAESLEQMELLRKLIDLDGVKSFCEWVEQTYEEVLPAAKPATRLQLLLPDRHPQKDFFICDALDAVPKDDLGSMEHPIFSLSTKPDTRIRRYEHNGIGIEVTPSVKGIATIFDKDVLIYIVSQLISKMEAGREPKRTVRLVAYDLLVATNRNTDGDAYVRLHEAFERLRGTTITTDVRTGGQRTLNGFGLIESWEIVSKSPESERMTAVEVTLSSWLFRAVVAKEVLTINRDYFRIRRPLQRRLYEIARKHCGHQITWAIGLELLHKKTGASCSLKEFRRMIRESAITDPLPDYRLSFRADTDQVIFYQRGARGEIARMKEVFERS